MKKILFIFIGAGVGFLLLWGGIKYWNNFSGVWPTLREAPEKIETMIPFVGEEEKVGPAINTTSMPLHLPPGFSISIFAKDLPGVRVLLFDGQGNILISQTSQGIISLLETKDGKLTTQKALLRNLKRPHGLALDPDDATILYFAEEDKVSRVKINPLGTPEKIITLPSGGNHFTRTIDFGPDGRLYVSIGSTCNVCNEEDSRRAKIFSMNKDGGDFIEYAKGLRNSVFFDWHPNTQKMWATEMGRDLIGDDIPPDEVNIVEENKDYGWPRCYGKNVHDTNFDKSPKSVCGDSLTVSSYIDLPAHSAPLGLAFVPGQGWPQDYRHDLLVAYHGSWNRSVPTGYKIVRYSLDAEGNIVDSKNTGEDFITGWLTEDNIVLGRPVDIKIGKDGIMYISDDKAGVIYQVKYVGSKGKKESRNDKSGCRATGCSGQLCANSDIMTTCEFRPEYSCYKNAECALQSSGNCGFTPTEELNNCVENKREKGFENLH